MLKNDTVFKIKYIVVLYLLVPFQIAFVKKYGRFV